MNKWEQKKRRQLQILWFNNTFFVVDAFFVRTFFCPIISLLYFRKSSYHTFFFACQNSVSFWFFNTFNCTSTCLPNKIYTQRTTKHLTRKKHNLNVWHTYHTKMNHISITSNVLLNENENVEKISVLIITIICYYVVCSLFFSFTWYFVQDGQ